jgi:dTDP-4-amino-4,6-dideoxygalactose transaminase
LIEELNKKKINCGVGSCPEIYREKYLKSLKFIQKKDYLNAKLLGETSIMFPINPNKNYAKIKLKLNIKKY